MDDNMEGGAWSRRSSSNDEGKFRQWGWLVTFFKLKKCTGEMYPDQEKALRAFKGNDIFFSSHKIYFRPISGTPFAQ